MNKLLRAFISLLKSFERGDLGAYADPAPPSDLGSPLTQDEIDFVKSLRKEMLERIPDISTCGEEVTGASIPLTVYYGFTAEWTNPADTVGTTIRYREAGTTDWLIPNATGNKHGAFNGTMSSFTFTDMDAGTEYDLLITNTCSSGIDSTGVIVSEFASLP